MSLSTKARTQVLQLDSVDELVLQDLRASGQTVSNRVGTVIGDRGGSEGCLTISLGICASHILLYLWIL